MSEKQKSRRIRFPMGLDGAIVDYAHKHRYSYSYVIRRAVEEFFRKEGVLFDGDAQLLVGGDRRSDGI